jgi:hypothetical protein
MEGGMDDVQLLQLLMQELGISPEMLLEAAAPKVAEAILKEIKPTEPAKEKKTAADEGGSKETATTPVAKPKTAAEQKRYQEMKTALQELLGRR